MPASSSEFDLPLYRDAQLYDAEHWWKTDDLQFWRELAAEYGPRVLELAAGTGRLALTVLESDSHYTGLEISAPFLERAQEKLASYGDRARLILGDMRDFHLGESFDLIFIGFNAFLHLLTDDDACSALRCMAEHCHAETRLAIDIFVPDPLFLFRPPNHRAAAMDYIDPIDGQSVSVTESNEYDPLTELNRISWYYSTAKRPDFLRYDFTMRMFYPDTMDRLLHECGFQVLEKWGDYGRHPFGPESALQLYLARPAGNEQ